MPNYKYIAVNGKGETLEGVFTASDDKQVLQMVRSKDYQPVKIEEVRAERNVELPNIFGKVRVKDLAVFCRQFYTMLKAGITIMQCLDILQQQTERKSLRDVITNLYESVQKGETLSVALKSHKDVFPQILISMVEAGEVSGSLDTIMERLAVHFEKENRIRNKVKSAMVYPIILSIVAVLVVAFLLTFVMPTFMGMFEGSGVQLPLPTRILISISDFLRFYWYIILAIIFGISYLIKMYISSDKGRLKFDELKLKMPMIKGVTTKVATARFTRTLSTLLASGIPLLQAMEVVGKVVGNKVIDNALTNAREEMRKGLGLSVPIKRLGLFPPMVSSMISIGEESGSLDEVLDETASFYDDEVETAMQKLVASFEPLMIVVMAVVIGGIVIAMILPMFDMINLVQ